MSRKMMARLIAMTPVIVIDFLGIRSHKTKAAESQLTIGQAACVSFVPSAWGDFKTGSPATGTVFQDAAGNLRFVNSFPCEHTTPIALEIHRSNPKSN